MFLTFQSAPPAREATSGARHVYPFGLVSIRAPRAGGDPADVSAWVLPAAFQSAPPAREATPHDHSERDGLFVSIRAPRAGGDFFVADPGGREEVSIRAPRAGGDVTPKRTFEMVSRFQSAPPAREATRTTPPVRPCLGCFNPRPPRGRRRPAPRPCPA